MEEPGGEVRLEQVVGCCSCTGSCPLPSRSRCRYRMRRRSFLVWTGSRGRPSSCRSHLVGSIGHSTDLKHVSMGVVDLDIGSQTTRRVDA